MQSPLERIYFTLCTLLDWTYAGPVTEHDINRALAEVARRLGEQREKADERT